MSDYYISPEDLARYPELPICLDYLLLREQGLGMQAIANRLHEKYNTKWKTRAWLYERLGVWRRNGTMTEAERRYMEPRIAEMNSAIMTAVEAWPQMIERMVKIATEGRSDKNALEAFAYLHEHIIGPSVSNYTIRPAFAEAAHLTNYPALSPLDAVDADINPDEAEGK